MNSKSIGFAVAIGMLMSAGVANADQPKDALSTNESKSESLPSVERSVELTVATGYAQAFGNVASSQPTLTDVGQAGGAVQIGAGYRLIPQLTLGAYGTGAMFSRGDVVDGSSKLYSATAGVQADWHFIPSGSEFDPWVSLGTGWRGYWVSADQGTTSLHGLELAKLQVGVDYRVAPSVAISPVVGADLSMFLTQATPSSNGFQSVSSPNVNTFVFAGLQGRFDIPTGSSAGKQVAAR